MLADGLLLSGKRIVVAEDDYLLATMVCRELEEQGATVLGPAPTPFYALHLIGPNGRRKIDAAVLDVHLHGLNVYEVADVLQDRGVPFIFTTGLDKTSMPKRFEAIPVMQKPFASAGITNELIKLLSEPQPVQLAQKLPAPSPSDEPPVAHFARALARQLVA
jgi:DNA-binding response OmpR family regulator